MNRNLTEAERDMWAATEAHFQPAAKGEEKASTRGGLRVMALFVVVVFVPAVTGVAALVRYIVQLGGQP